MLWVVQLADGHIVSVSWDKSLRVWDIATGSCSCIQEPTRHTGAVNCVVQLVDGDNVSANPDQLLLRVSNDYTLN